MPVDWEITKNVPTKLARFFCGLKRRLGVATSRAGQPHQPDATSDDRPPHFAFPRALECLIPASMPPKITTDQPYLSLIQSRNPGMYWPVADGLFGSLNHFTNFAQDAKAVGNNLHIRRSNVSELPIDRHQVLTDPLVAGLYA